VHVQKLQWIARRIVLRALVFFAAAVLQTAAQAAVTPCTPTAGFTACLRYTFSGANQTFVVPTGVTNIEVRAWGAAGGGTNLARGYFLQGGGAGGGYARGTLAVTPGATMTVVAGGGGALGSNTSPYGFGGAGGNSTVANIRGGAGGGLSGIFATATVSRANARLVAGGGGGASPGADSGVAGAGGGGATSGGQDALPGRSGRGGTQAAGGAAATTNSGCSILPTAGAGLQGGNGGSVNGTGTNEGGGGGGGGYFGGGGGMCQGAGDQNGGGGGGSSYIAHPSVTGATTSAGQNFFFNNTGANCSGTANSGGTTDAFYTAGIGQGSCYGNGGNGEVVIQYLITTITVTKISNGDVGTFTFTGSNGYAGDSITTLTSGTPQPGQKRFLANANTATTVTETIPPGYKITAINCTGVTPANYSANLATGEVTFLPAAITVTADIACTFTNEKLAPALTLLKTATPAGPVNAGQVITYTFRVTNSGNTPLNNIVVNETAFTGLGTPHPIPGNESLLTDNAPTGDSTNGVANDGVWATLGPGDVITMTGTYTVMQADIDNQ
jgi:trimeric autotransporter adhesin